MRRNSMDERLEALYRKQDADTRFRRLRAGATQFVPGDGLLRPTGPRLILVGEAPGATEDARGTPFVGRSGRFLDECLRVAGLTRGQVWITNVVKYRPTERDETARLMNRTPDPDEIAASVPYLKQECALVAGTGRKLIVGLGRVACEAIAGDTLSVSQLHGNWRELKHGWRLFISYHPSWAIRGGMNKTTMLYDFETLGKKLQKLQNNGL